MLGLQYDERCNLLYHSIEDIKFQRCLLSKQGTGVGIFLFDVKISEGLARRGNKLETCGKLSVQQVLFMQDLGRHVRELSQDLGVGVRYGFEVMHRDMHQV